MYGKKCREKGKILINQRETRHIVAVCTLTKAGNHSIIFLLHLGIYIRTFAPETTRLYGSRAGYTLQGGRIVWQQEKYKSRICTGKEGSKEAISETAVVKEEVKAAVKEAAEEVKAVAKKAPVKKPAARKAAEPSAAVHFQYNGRDIAAKEVLAAAMEDFKKNHPDEGDQRV